MARPKGRTNARPSKTAIKTYYEMLKSAAGKGDVNAAGKLIELEHMKSQTKSSPTL